MPEPLTEIRYDSFGKNPTLYLRQGIIEETRCKPVARGLLTVLGYTVRAGSPTDWQVRLRGEQQRWRRVYAWQFSNAATMFVRIKGEPAIIDGFEPPKDTLHPSL